MSTVHGPGDVGSPQQRAARTHPRGRGPPPCSKPRPQPPPPPRPRQRRGRRPRWQLVAMREEVSSLFTGYVGQLRTHRKEASISVTPPRRRSARSRSRGPALFLADLVLVCRAAGTWPLACRPGDHEVGRVAHPTPLPERHVRGIT